MAPEPLPFDPIAEAARHWDEQGWGRARSGMATVTSVMRVQQIMLARVDEQLRPFDLSFARYEVLMLLRFSRTGRLPLGKMGARLQVHSSSVTNAVDRLEAQGLVRRVANAADRRSTLAEITDRGRRVAEQATERLNQQVFAPLEVAESEQADLFASLRRIRLGAGDFPGGLPGG
jgi:DNA-binding MarR family transcriptional regulator